MGFPIIGWAQMPKELTRDAVYANIAQSGINVVMTCSEPLPLIRDAMTF